MPRSRGTRRYASLLRLPWSPSLRIPPRPLVLASAVLLVMTLTGCEHVQSAADPAGPRAAATAMMILVTTVIGGITWAIVVALLLFGIARRRGAAPGPYGGKVFVIVGGAVFPAVVMLGLWLYSGLTLADLDDLDDEPEVLIEIVGHQWWWEVRYPDHGVVTANEIHIPAGFPVQLRLTSADVIHSFWVPSLAGKIDLLPGEGTSLWIEADEPGTYRGQCAEFCGIQHAHMAFHVVAQEPEAFAEWVALQAEPAPEPDSDVIQTGQQIFLGSACSYCHTIRGTNASGDLGPDLTHLASRQHLAAGLVPLNRGSVGGWILDPQNLKPGVLMPPTQLTPEELNALISYLMWLE